MTDSLISREVIQKLDERSVEEHTRDHYRDLFRLYRGVFVDIDSGEVSLGNRDEGNYITIEEDGTLVFNGNATVFDDLQVGLNNLAKGATAPTDRTYDHGTGGIAYPVLGFAKNEYIWFDVQTSHSMKLSTVLNVHLHFVLPNTITIGHKIVWQLDVMYAAVDGTWTVPVGSPYTATHTVAANDDTTGRILDIADIPAVNTTVSTLYKCRLTRIDGTATEYASECYLEFIDCHYEKDTAGSRTEYSK
jgi:hypothetical protein